MSSDTPANPPTGQQQPTPVPVLGRRDQFETFEEAVAKARRRLPRSIFAEMFSGSDRAVTLRRNVEVFDDVVFQPRSAVATSMRDQSTTVLGSHVSLPVLIAPVGGLRIVHPLGALATARAAEGAGTIAGISMGAGHSVSDVSSAASGPLWQQIYMSRGREQVESVIAQARAAGHAALVVTVDSAVPPKRRTALRINLSNAREFTPELIIRPGWTYRFVRDGMQLRLINEAVGVNTDSKPKIIAEWEDFDWIREAWGGPLVVKGIVTPDDARRAVDAGADAVVVSNHGGLTLDGTMPSLKALPRVARAVNGDAEVLLDGGIRRGTDVVKAIALGARAVLIGRPYVAGLAVAGEAGVRTVLENFRYEIDRTLGFLGAGSLAEIDGSFVEFPDSWT